ncbi:MAG TPA: A/G-specific adenine glycosylase [Thermoplasmata archaeon]|nr:A/G-specific adenine glycosylase [Thermoplasmata archaeon]
MGEPDRRELQRRLLAWYRATKRDLSFRRSKDPYAILVAEIVLQRTRVKAGLPYYERFLAAFPTVRDLAAASEADVLRVWEGLGFYGRARNLHRAAKAIVERHGGRVPADVDALRALPGIGDYTAGAVGSIAFGLPAPAVDGNVTRVLARVFRIEEDAFRGPGRRRIQDLAAELVPEDAPGEWNQALMELGATVCVPTSPRCPICPISSECAAFGGGVQASLPRKPAKREVPTVPVVFVIARRRGAVLLVRRERGLHAGLFGLPGGERASDEGERDAVRRHLSAIGLQGSGLRILGPVRHAFSHRTWEGSAFAARVRGTSHGAVWVPAAKLAETPLIPLHRQILGRAMS